MITREEFLKNTNEEELFTVFESVCLRCYQRIEKKHFKHRNPIDDELMFYITDKEKHKAIRETLKEWKA